MSRFVPPPGADTGPRIHADGYTLVALPDRRYWLVAPTGEALQTTEEKITELLEAFFIREF